MSDMSSERTPAQPPPLTERRLATIERRLREGLPVRRRMPVWGRLHVDRPLPFLVLYRRPEQDDTGTDTLATTSASYLQTDAAAVGRDAQSRVLDLWAATASERFGSCLIVEIWAGSGVRRDDDGGLTRPAFVVHTSGEDDLASTVGVLAQRLGRVSLAKKRATVDIAEDPPHPPGIGPPLPPETADTYGCRYIGIEVTPVFREAGEVFPIVLRKFRRRISRALTQAFYEYVSARTDLEPEHYFQVGRRSLVKAVFEMDERLTRIDDSFDMLLQATPINAEQAWQEFERSGFEAEPTFRYRPLPIAPDEAKRELYAMRIDRVEDPTLMRLLADKRRELDRQLTMLTDIGTARFRYGSLALHGTVSDGLLNEARGLLEELPPRRTSRDRTVDAEHFADLAREEAASYAKQLPGFEPMIEVTDDLYAGLLVSKGRLLISSSLQLTPDRARALVAHEVGTHVLTYHNGLAQPLRLLHAGLPGYDAMQEGLAVASEYLVGGLDASRLRVLAARVVAVEAMSSGSTFVETHRLLTDDFDFEAKTAFTIAMRVHRAGGLMKDAAYLAGLERVLAHLASGGEYETLFVGKFALRHLPVIRELLMREVLIEAPLLPTFLSDPDSVARLERLRGGMRAIDLPRG